MYCVYIHDIVASLVGQRRGLHLSAKVRRTISSRRSCLVRAAAADVKARPLVAKAEKYSGSSRAHPYTHTHEEEEEKAKYETKPRVVYSIVYKWIQWLCSKIKKRDRKTRVKGRLAAKQIACIYIHEKKKK